MEKTCFHHLKHTERLILPASLETEYGKLKYCIITYCADCGLELNYAECYKSDKI